MLGKRVLFLERTTNETDTNHTANILNTKALTYTILCVHYYSYNLTTVDVKLLLVYNQLPVGHWVYHCIQLVDLPMDPWLFITGLAQLEQTRTICIHHLINYKLPFTN